MGSSPSSKRDDSNTHHNSRQSSPFSSSDSTDTANSGSPALDEELSTNSPISKSKTVNKLNQKSATLSDQTTVIKDIQKQQHEQLRGFKIPKQASIQHSHKTVDSNSNGSNDSHGNSNTNHSYYHPKKNHYMMYMMENKGCSQQSNSG